MDSELQRAITQLRDRSPGSSHSTRSYIDLSFEGRTLQLRSDQLTVSNIARTFRLIPETIILVSESGTVAIPDGENGVFPDLNSSLTWVVEGDKSTFRPNQPGPFQAGSASGSNPPSKERWKPHAFSRAQVGGASSSVAQREVGHDLYSIRNYVRWPLANCPAHCHAMPCSL